LVFGIHQNVIHVHQIGVVPPVHAATVTVSREGIPPPREYSDTHPDADENVFGSFTPVECE
jgi:hypothetical protein